MLSFFFSFLTNGKSDIPIVLRLDRPKAYSIDTETPVLELVYVLLYFHLNV